MMKAGFSGKSVNMATGIPLNLFYDDDRGVNEKNKERKKKAWCKMPVFVGSATSFTPVEIDVNPLEVVPEAFAGWFGIRYELDGSDNFQDLSSPVGVVDIGGRTTDVAVINPDLGVEPKYTETFRIGHLDIYKELKNILKEQFTISDYDVRVLDKAVRTKEINILGEKKYIEKEVNLAIKRISNKIMRAVDVKFSDVELPIIAYIGGGSETLRGELSMDEKNFIPDRPQFANARGYLKFMKIMNP